MRLTESPTIHPTATVQDARLGRYVEIGERTRVVESSMDDYSYVSGDSDIIYASIGKFCSIAAQVRINPGNHPHWRASQSHFTYRASAYFDGEADEEAFFDWRRSEAVTVGHDVWIGHGAIVLAGNAVGTGAIVAAGAVVSRPVAPYSIVAGVPARTIRMRFPADVASGLAALAWWDWDHQRLQSALPDFRELTAAAFLEKHARG